MWTEWIVWMWPQGAFPHLPGTPGYLQSDKGHGLGSGNLVEKYLSYNKIGNLVSFSSIPQITPSHPPRYNNLPFAMKHNLRDFYIWLFRHLILKKSAYFQTKATEGTRWQSGGRPPLGPKCPSLQAHTDFGSFNAPLTPKAEWHHKNMSREHNLPCVSSSLQPCKS